jgi:hypothetical protein
LLRGLNVLRSAKTPWLCTRHAIVAWALSRFSSGTIFSLTQPVEPERSFTACLSCCARVASSKKDAA